MIYAAMALAARFQFSSSKHSGVIAFFDREVVKTGTLPKDLSRVLHMAFALRQSNDSGEILTAYEEEARQVFQSAQNFVDREEDYLTKS